MFNNLKWYEQNTISFINVNKIASWRNMFPLLYVPCFAFRSEKYAPRLALAGPCVSQVKKEQRLISPA